MTSEAKKQEQNVIGYEGKWYKIVPVSASFAYHEHDATREMDRSMNEAWVLRDKLRDAGAISTEVKESERSFDKTKSVKVLVLAEIDLPPQTVVVPVGE